MTTLREQAVAAVVERLTAVGTFTVKPVTTWVHRAAQHSAERMVRELMQDGADAPKEVKQAFDALGITMADVQKHGDDMGWMLAAMADGFAGVKTQAEKTTIAKALFGREGAKLIPLLEQGAEKLREEEQAARDAGAVLSEDLVKAYDALGDRLDLAAKKLEVQKGRIFPEAAAAATRYGEAVAGAAETIEASPMVGDLLAFGIWDRGRCG